MLIYHELPERFAHSCSFDMSDLSHSLTVTPLSWVIWANRSLSLIWFEPSEQVREWGMSKWANSQPCVIFGIGVIQQFGATWQVPFIFLQKSLYPFIGQFLADNGFFKGLTKVFWVFYNHNCFSKIIQLRVKLHLANLW